jgi:hypothetical protein
VLLIINVWIYFMKSIPQYSKNNYTYLANYHTLLIFFAHFWIQYDHCYPTWSIANVRTDWKPHKIWALLIWKQYVPEGRYGLPYPRSVANYAVLVANASRGIRVWGQCRLYWGVSWLQGSSQFCRCLISQHTSPTTVFCSLTVSTGWTMFSYPT